MPPSTGSITPVTYDAAGLSTNAATRANSAGCPVRRRGIPASARARTAGSGPSSSASRSVATRPGSSPLTRTPCGPSSSAIVLASIPRPGRRPLLAASPPTGALTLVESTSAIEPPSAGSAGTTARHRRTAPRKTLSKALRHCSSDSPTAGPGGGPPTLMSAPSRRPYACSAASTSRWGASGSAASATTPVQPSRSAAAATACGSRADSTTCAPSCTSTSAVASPRPRDPPVTRNALPASPRSIPGP